MIEILYFCFYTDIRIEKNLQMKMFSFLLTDDKANSKKF